MVGRYIFLIVASVMDQSLGMDRVKFNLPNEATQALCIVYAFSASVCVAHFKVGRLRNGLDCLLRITKV